MTNTNENNIPNLTRANRISVKSDSDIFTADFFRTHAKVGTISSNETGWTPNADMNRSAQREDFRQFAINHAADIGIDYDPEDRRTPANTRISTYFNDEILKIDVESFIQHDIRNFIAAMPDTALVKGHEIVVDDIRPKTHTSKGNELSTMGIIDGKYEKNGNWAWADIDVTVTLTVGKPDAETQEIYYPMCVELVSCQLKKCRITQTAWNTSIRQSLMEIGLVAEEVKAEKSKPEPKEKSKPDVKTEEVSAETPAKKTRKASKSKKEDKAE